MKQMKRIRFCDQCNDKREAGVLERETAYPFRRDGLFTITERYAKRTVCGYDVTDEELDSETLRKWGRLYENKHTINADWMRERRVNVLTLHHPPLQKCGALPSITEIDVLKSLREEPEGVQ